MKLIAETDEENMLLNGLGALLTDLGISVTEYRKEEAFASVFWSALELSQVYAARFHFTYESAAAFLDKLEPELHMAMVSAGAELIEDTLSSRLPHTEPSSYDIFRFE